MQGRRLPRDMSQVALEQDGNARVMNGVCEFRLIAGVHPRGQPFAQTGACRVAACSGEAIGRDGVAETPGRNMNSRYGLHG